MQTHDLNADQVFRAIRAHCFYMSDAALSAALERVEEMLVSHSGGKIDSDIAAIIRPLRGLSQGTSLNIIRCIRQEFMPDVIVKTAHLTLRSIRTPADTAADSWNKWVLNKIRSQRGGSAHG